MTCKIYTTLLVYSVGYKIPFTFNNLTRLINVIQQSTYQPHTAFASVREPKNSHLSYLEKIVVHQVESGWCYIAQSKTWNNAHKFEST